MIVIWTQMNDLKDFCKSSPFYGALEGWNYYKYYYYYFFAKLSEIIFRKIFHVNRDIS